MTDKADAGLAGMVAAATAEILVWAQWHSMAFASPSPVSFMFENGTAGVLKGEINLVCSETP